MLLFTLALRELRGGVRDFRIFLSCLMIGVIVIAAVGTLSSQIEHGIKEQAKTLLGGDVEISLTDLEATPEQLRFFASYGTYSLSTSLRAMATHGDNAVLVELKGVDAAYPLLGQVQLASALPLNQALPSGSVVAEQSLFGRLSVKPHDTITIGTTNFTLSDIVQKEPDHIASAFGLGLRVIARIDDLHKSGLLMPGGLVKYNYHILLKNPSELDAFKKACAEKFPSAPWIIKTFNDNNRTVKTLVERLQLFMTLAGLSSLLIGGVGILNATESYVNKKLETIAIMKTLGATRHEVFFIYIIVLFMVTLIGSLPSAIIGTGLGLYMLPFLAAFFPVSSHITIAYSPVILAAAFGMLTVFSFSIAVLGRAVEVKPTLLFRGLETIAHPLPWAKLVANIILIVALIALLLYSAKDMKIAIGFIGSAIACFIIFALAAHSTKKLAQKIKPTHRVIRLAIGNLYRPGSNIFSIMLSVGIGLTVLIALLQVEANIRREIDETIPANAPSLFLIDVQPSQKDAFLTLLHSKPYISDIAYAPMIRGRISKLKDIPVENAPISSDAKWATESDRGLSYAADLPPGTQLIKGNWWPVNYSGKPLLSLDQALAKGMGLDVGDNLTLNIQGKEITAQVASLRNVNYANFHINFTMILSPGALEQFPATFITTARVADDNNETALVSQLSKHFSNISTIRIKESLLQLKEIVGDISSAILITALSALVSGLLVLASALAATLDKRNYDTIMMKVLGATKRTISSIFLVEWFILAMITGLLASLLGSLGAWLIMQRFDWVVFRPVPSIILTTLFCAWLFISGIGLFIQSRIFKSKPSAILRNE